jgi:multidrug resistance efflux pump
LTIEWLRLEKRRKKLKLKQAKAEIAQAKAEKLKY